MQSATELQEFGSRIDSLLQKVEDAANPSLREDIRELIRSLMTLHQKALASILNRLSAEADGGERLIRSMVADPLVDGLLALHDLHPEDVEARVRRAIDRAAHSLHIDATFLTCDGSTVRLRLGDSIHGCQSTRSQVHHIFESAILDIAPEISSVEMEGGPPALAETLVQLDISPIAASRQ